MKYIQLRDLLLYDPSFDLQHLRETYPQPRESDLSPTLLTFMYNVALAQAQECILEKSMTDNRKPNIIGMNLKCKQEHRRNLCFLLCFSETYVFVVLNS